MTPRQRELLDIIAATVHAARLAALELRETTSDGDVRGVVQDMANSLHGISDDARAEHASGLLCEVFEGLKDGAGVEA